MGLPAEVVKLVPGLQSKIFTLEADSYVWADVAISGTIHAMEEDLSPRLLALAQDEGQQILESGKDALEDKVKSAINLFESF